MTRPACRGPFPEWASDVNYPAGGNSWNATPTKVNPGAGPIAAGYTPNVPPGAQVDNFFQNLESRFLRYLDQIDVLNWADGISVAIVTAEPSAVVFSPARNVYWIFGPSQAKFSFEPDFGGVWTDDSAAYLAAGGATGTQKVFAAASAATGRVWEVTDQGPQTTYWLGTWTGYALTPTLSYCTSNVFDPYATLSGSTVGVFLAGGAQAPVGFINYPCLFIGTETAGGITAALATLTGAAGIFTGGASTNEVKYVASGAPNGSYVAIAISVGDNPCNQWYTHDATHAAAWTNNGIGGSGAVPFTNPVSLAYSAADQAFLVLEANGHAWVSTDGAAWTQQHGGASYTVIGQLTTRGSIWIALASALPGSIYGLIYSVDLGVTWTVIPWPVAQSKVPKLLTLGDRRFLTVGYSGTSAWPVLSLRTAP